MSSNTFSLPRTVGYILIGAGMLYAVFVFIQFPRFTVDDAFITLRYAQNLSEHGELNWNIGEDPVEGYTGVLMPLLLAGALESGFPLQESARFIGIFSFFVSFAFLFLVLRALQVPLLAQGLLLLLFGTLPVLFTHASSGLETMLFLAASLLSILLFLRSTQNPDAPPSLFFASLLALGLIRPEGALLGFLLLLAALLQVAVNRPQRLKAFLLHGCVFFLLPGAVYFLWRFNYYGRLLPNTFYVKGATGLYPDNLLDMARFFRRFFGAPILAAIFLLALEPDALFSGLKAKIKDGVRMFRPTGFLLAALVVFGAFLLLLISTSHLLMNYSGRFYIPLLPMIFAILGLLFFAGFSVISNTRNEKPLRFKVALGIVFFLTLYQAAFNLSKLSEEKRYVWEQKLIHESEHMQAGLLLRDLPPDEWLVVYIDAGAAPFFSQLKTVDFGRLNDEFLARKGVSEEEKVEYFFSKNPGALLVTSEDSEKLSYTKEIEMISKDPRFSNYVLRKKFLSPIPTVRYNQFLYVRKDLQSRI